MMKIKIIVYIVCCLSVINIAFAAEKTPKIVTDGMEIYKEKGYEDAFNTWLKNSPMESDKELMKNLKDAINQIEGLYGKMKKFEILANVRVSSDTIRTYAEISYEKGPIFFYFDCFKTEGGNWIIPVMNMNSKIDRVLPESIVTGK